jgi:hypothetical protein
MEGFRAPTKTRALIGPWRKPYNVARPHSSLGGITLFNTQQEQS